MTPFARRFMVMSASDMKKEYTAATLEAHCAEFVTIKPKVVALQLEVHCLDDMPRRRQNFGKLGVVSPKPKKLAKGKGKGKKE